MIINIMNKREKDKSAILLPQQNGNKEKVELSGYPLYPASEDIYIKYEEEKNINPEDITNTKTPNESIKSGTNDDKSGSDLDVPGSELDDVQENIGSEDEENNYYSLGGDDHNDLDEDRGE